MEVLVDAHRSQAFRTSARRCSCILYGEHPEAEDNRKSDRSYQPALRPFEPIHDHQRAFLEQSHHPVRWQGQGACMPRQVYKPFRETSSDP